MHWIAPLEKDNAVATLERRPWDSADQFRANSGLKSWEYSAHVLGHIYLSFAEVRFANQHAKLEKAGASSGRGFRVNEPAAYHADGILYPAPNAWCDFLLADRFARIKATHALAEISAEIIVVIKQNHVFHIPEPDPKPAPDVPSAVAAYAVWTDQMLGH